MGKKTQARATTPTVLSKFAPRSAQPKAGAAAAADTTEVKTEQDPENEEHDPVIHHGMKFEEWAEAKAKLAAKAEA